MSHALPVSELSISRRPIKIPLHHSFIHVCNGIFLIHFSKYTLTCQIFYPFIFSEVMKYPWQFTDFINTSAGVNYHNWPMEIISSCCRQWNCQAPHAYCQAVHIKQCITTCAKNSINRYIINRTSDHIDSNDSEHPFQICSCLRCQLHEMQHNRCCHTH